MSDEGGTNIDVIAELRRILAQVREQRDEQILRLQRIAEDRLILIKNLMADIERLRAELAEWQAAAAATLATVEAAVDGEVQE